MLKYYNYYEKSYEKFTPDWFSEENSKSVNQYLKENSESIINFLTKYSDQFNLDHREFYDKNVLVLGCGLGGLAVHMARQNSNVTGIDVSELAIMGARQIADLKGLSIDYKVIDICMDDIDGEYDYIIDDHLLHCLTTIEDRKKYFEFVKNHLKKESGVFMLETMSYQSQFQTPVGYTFDEDNILWKSVNSEEIMIRKVLDSIEIENEIKDSGLNINYLYYHSELAFQVFSEYDDYPFQYLPRTIRLTARI
jgi:2-polyprenyl-3-methyl-5-hydroxy-6-metoxy-1,4-benzoquinol methylase